MARQQDNIAGTYDPAVVLTSKGMIMAHDGTEPVSVLAGPDGWVPTYDSTAPAGIRPRPIGTQAFATANATNQFLLRLGM